jgi:T-complex protein 1 subunit theta
LDAGVRVVIAGSSVGELALHYLNRLGIAVLKIPSKFELRRLCRVVGATPLARMGPPTPEEAGHADVFEVVEIGGDRCTVVRQLGPGEPGYDPSGGERARTATVVLRGATTNRLDDLERAVDDGVNVLKSLLKDARLVPGAGATELTLSKAVDAHGAAMKGLAQHAVRRYAQALEVIPRTLAENALGGAEGNEVLSRLWAKHETPGGDSWGVDIEVRPIGGTFGPSLMSIAGGGGWYPRRCGAQDLGPARSEALGNQAGD